MLKNIIGAALGSSIAKNSPTMGGATGAAIASAVPFVLSRVSLPALAVIGVGGYVAKRYFDKRNATKQTEEMSGTKVANPGEAPKRDTGSVIDPPPAPMVNGSGVAQAATASSN